MQGPFSSSQARFTVSRAGGEGEGAYAGGKLLSPASGQGKCALRASQRAGIAVSDCWLPPRELVQGGAGGMILPLSPHPRTQASVTGCWAAGPR